MKTAFSTLFCMELSVPEILGLAKETEINGVELRVDEGMLTELQEDKKTISKVLDSEIRICDIASSIFVRGEGETPLWKSYVKLAKDLSCPALRVFAAANRLGVTDIDGIIHDLKKLCDVAAEHNIEIWLENHSELSEGKICRQVLDAVNKKNLKILWDVLHSIEYGETISETLSYIGDFISQVHLKDGVPNENGGEYKLCALGEGSFPFAEVVESLRNINFDGYLSLEWESKWHPHLSGIYADNFELLIKYKEILQKAGALK